MAINIMAAVWKHSQYREEKLLVLLALADWANEEGVCWPSMRALAAKARITERGAQKIIRRLAADKVIEVLESGGGRGHTAKYRIKGEPRNTECRNTVSTNGVCGDRKRVNVEARKGERGDSAIRKEPSGTVIEPSAQSAQTWSYELKKSDPARWERLQELARERIFAERLALPGQEKMAWFPDLLDEQVYLIAAEEESAGQRVSI